MKDKLISVLKFINAKKHQIFTFTVGLAFIALVCFGIFSVAMRIYHVFVPQGIYADENVENTLFGGSVYEAVFAQEYEEASPEFFENYLDNFIRQDIAPFDDPSQISDESIISFGLWQAITLNNAQGVYGYTNKGSFRVPAKDVEMYASYCLDYASKVSHGTVDECGKFKYSKLSKTYTIPSAGVEEYLMPDVIKVEEGENDTYIVTVDCYNASQMSAEDPTNDPDNFVRRVKITMQDMGIQNYNAQTGNPVPRYTILSMQGVSEDEIKAENETEGETEKDDKDDIELN